MRTLSRVLVFAAAGLIGCLTSGLFAADLAADFGKAKTRLQQQAKSKLPAERISAVEELSAFPVAESVKLLHALLGDGESEVRNAAYVALMKMSSSPEVCDTLLPLAKKSSQAKNNPAAAAPALAVLLTSDSPAVTRATIEILDKSTIAVTLCLADELGSHGTEIDVLPLARLSKTTLFTKNYPVRRAVVDALIKIRSTAAVGALIDILPEVRGEDGADALEYLSQLTQQFYGLEARAWQTWWADAKDTFKYPPNFKLAPYRSKPISGGSDYYGLPVVAQRMVFIIDTSKSMEGLRLEAAKRELVRAIEALDEENYFGIVAFNDAVDVWQKRLVLATPSAKRMAISYVNSQSAQAFTASYDSLEAAFKFDAEAIYFLSDGEPTSGKISVPHEIVKAVTANNNLRRISVYTIGIGAGRPGSALDEFLRSLAASNYGLYRRVDQ